MGTPTPPEKFCSSSTVWNSSVEPFLFWRWKTNREEEEPAEPQFLNPPAPCYSAATVIKSDRARAYKSCAKRSFNDKLHEKS